MYRFEYYQHRMADRQLDKKQRVQTSVQVF